MSDVTGVQCAVCHQETFRTVKRRASFAGDIYVDLLCCPRCARKIDAAEEEAKMAGQLEILSKAERKIVLKERSRDWAQSWHGKSVVVSYPIRVGYEQYKDYRIRGTAYFGCLHEDIGWGRVRVVLDESELGRLEWWPYHKGTQFPVDWKEKDELIPVIDGYRWGLGTQIISDGHWSAKRNAWDTTYQQPLAFYVNWGSRDEYVLEEFDEAAEREAAMRKEERKRLEEWHEIQKHLGEGI